MELRYLRYFVAVADVLHFGRAARSLHIAQPPLSQQIRRLEQELGVDLFHRTNRRVELTDAGRAFLVEARATLAQAERARDVVTRAARGEVGHLIVGHMASAEFTVFPRLLPVFRKRHPSVELTFQLLGVREQLQMLHERQIHAGFLRLPANDPALTVKTILREALVVVLPKRHRLARRRSVTLPELRGERFVLFPRHHAPGYHDALVAICRQVEEKPAITRDTTRLHTLLSLVATGRGVFLTGQYVSRLHRAGVVCRSLRPPGPPVETGLAYDPGNPSRLLQAFVAVVDEVFASAR